MAGSAEAAPRRAKAARSSAAPRALANENADLWRALAPSPAEPILSPRATRVLATFETRGASFAAQAERETRLMRAEFEEGLAELVAAGRLTADSFAGLRALLANPARLRTSRLDLIANTNAGRWSLLPPPDPLADPVV